MNVAVVSVTRIILIAVVLSLAFYWMAPGTELSRNEVLVLVLVATVVESLIRLLPLRRRRESKGS